MSANATIKVRAVPGKLLPPLAPPYRPETWIGWRLCSESEDPEMVLPKGHGVFDRPARRVMHQGKEHVLPKIENGRDLRLIRILDGVDVPDSFEYRRAILDGDLELITA